ncbi:probable beta-D-xylosidase 7 [Triticum dicoccoides]|uniref:probable beta-D-xylosidase 7 n=1 Tax=Triticum dicoccoides TaxID=85692 RepID=UPI00188FAB52|nr:probable beta-D-xylosidase 7 [Triticum dicoccoides]
MGRRTHAVQAAALLLLLAFLHLHVAAAADPPFSCGAASGAPYCDRKLPMERRAADLVSKLSLEEKISQLGDESPAVARLGVPAYKWWSEALHGVAWSKGMHLDGPLRAATSFPQVILTAASFNPHLWYRIGQVIGREARGVYNNGQAEGLTLWAPNINVFRDPRWGRGQETPGEDPSMTGKYAAVFVRGVQGYGMSGAINSSDLEASACCKHFTAYDLDNWKGVTRFAFDAKVTEQDLADTYNPPFKSCVEDGGASGIMCSYNRVNGVPTCADHNLLSKTARGDWSFNGYITSDCDAVAIIHDVQGYAKAAEDAVADVLKAGMDVNCGGYIQTHGVSAYRQGKITGEDIDRALRNLFAIRMRLGLFNGNPKYNRYGNIGAGQVCSKEHQDLALQAAQDGIVLLKNHAGALPLSKSRLSSSSIAVIGPNGNNASLLLGNYFGPPCISVTPFQALQGYVKDARFVQGCKAAVCNVSDIGEAVHAAGSADYVVLFMGLDQDQEKEEVDRLDLGLPGMQESLVSKVADAAKKPVILVLLCGGPVDVTFAKNNPKIGAIVWAGYPGQAGGIAIAQVLFGEHNPGGRLPVTWYPKEFTAVPMTDMRMRADPSTGYPGRTYRFYKGKTVYNFGYGLSYSKYSHRFASKGTRPPSTRSGIEGLKATASAAGTVSYDVEEMGAEACDRLRFPAVVRVQNHGPMDGRHPVLLFLRWPNATDGRPASQLVGFQSVHLKADEAAHVEFEVSPCKHLSRAAEDGRKVIDQGSHFLKVGDDEFELSFMA